MKSLHNLITFQPVNHIVEADIKGFFDNVPHEELLKFLRIRVVDTTLLDLIEKFLKAGYIDDGKLIETDMRTPQGSILSPILCAKLRGHFQYYGVSGNFRGISRFTIIL